MKLADVTEEKAGLALLAHAVWLAGFLLLVALVTAPQLGVSAILVALSDPEALPSFLLVCLLPVVLVGAGLALAAFSAVAGELLRRGHGLGRPLAASAAVLNLPVNPTGPVVAVMVAVAILRRP